MMAAPSQPQMQQRRPRQEEGRRGDGEGGLRVPRFMAAACWITNTGNLKSPPVMSFLLFHSSSPPSNTITLLYGLSLFSSLFYSSSLIHYPVTEYLLWQTQGGGKFLIIDSSSGSKAKLRSITPLWPVQTRSPSHKLSHNSARISDDVSY